MLKVERFVNELMTSNCYLVYDNDTKKCIVIDPGSEKSLREIAFIEEYHLQLDYVIITHEHTDHNWGVNALREKFPSSKMICSEICNKNVKRTNRTYFLFYYDNPDYRYEIAPADILIERENEMIIWEGHEIVFYLTPGHSFGSMCIRIKDILFTGDTIMPYPPYFNGRDSNPDDWENSIENILSDVPKYANVYPGHGNSLLLNNWAKNKEFRNKL